MHWILVYNALFFFDFLFNRIVPNLYISNAGLGTFQELQTAVWSSYFILRNRIRHISRAPANS